MTIHGLSKIGGSCICLLLFVTCQQPKESISVPQIVLADSLQSPESDPLRETDLHPGKLEEALQKAGLVNIQKLDSSILVDLKYSTTDNFVGVDVYGSLKKAYLQPEVAQKLVQAQKYLKDNYPNYLLLIYDAARPKSVQQILWDTLDKPSNIKHFYVANPDEGSIHNYGSAVDLTIANENGKPLDMGTGYDFFGELAYPSKEAELLAKGLLRQKQIDNREILRSVMRKAGFTPITTEWWHFNALSRTRAAETYEIIE